MSAFAEIAAYEPEELILEAGAGTRLAEIEALIAARGQQLAFEPPDLSRLLGSPHSGTLGGLMACNLSGPRRIKAGAARDHMLGIRGVSGRGEVFKAGARVVKNVTGYDLPKLLTGSYGTLAALTSITVKVLPAAGDGGNRRRRRPRRRRGRFGHEPRHAIGLRSLRRRPCAGRGELSCGSKASQHRSPTRRDALAKLLARPVADPRGQGLWRDVAAHSRRSAILPTRRTAWSGASRSRRRTRRRSLAILRGSLEIRYVFDWAGGLIWLDVPPTEDAAAAVIRGAMRSGHATLIRAPEGVRAAVDVFQPQAPALAALSARVKDSFDPRRLFNPGRM